MSGSPKRRPATRPEPRLPVLRRPPARRSAQETVLAEWRGIDWAPLEKAQRLSARATAQLVPEVVEKLGLEQRRAETEVLKAWNSLLDPALTAHAQPSGLRHGTLFVSVDSSVWLAEIVRYRQKEILERLRSSFGANLIKKVSFRLG